MKFIVSRNELYKNLTAISGVLPSNSTFPILDNFLFTLSGKTLTLTASDNDCTMIAEIGVETAEGEGSVAVPSSYLLKTLKLIQDEEITFKTKEHNYNITLTFSTKDGVYNLSSFKGDEYPKNSVLGGNTISFDIKSGILYRAINKTLFATSNDDLRPTMMGVLCELNEDGITFVATDAHKLVKYSNSSVKTDTPTSFILPKKPLQQLRNVIGNSDETIRIEYSQDSNRVRITFGKLVLYSILLEGNYPNYKRVIPTPGEKTLVVSKDELLRCIKRINVYSNESNHQIRMSLENGNCVIRANDVNNSKKANEVVNGEYTGDKLEIGFNGKYLNEMLNSIDEDEVRICLSDYNRPGIIFPEGQKDDDDDEHVVMLIMPMKLD